MVLDGEQVDRSARPHSSPRATNPALFGADPATPKAERFIHCALRQWAHERPDRTSAHRNAALPDLLDSCNLEGRAAARAPAVAVAGPT